MKRPALLLATFSTLFALTSPTIAHEEGTWIVRAGAALVAPDESSSRVSTTSTGAIPGTRIGVDNDTQLGLNIAYMVTDNIGIELLAATPFEHDLSASSLGLSNFGSVKHLPPTLSAQYYFGQAQSTVRPYVGAGINYTIFFEESLSPATKTALGASNLELDNSLGLALQAGVDVKLDERWFLNAVVWKIDIDTEATLDTALGKASVDVAIDPWVYMLSVGYTF